MEEIIDAAKAAGLSYVEWGSDVHAPKDDGENLDRVARLTREAGLQISSYGTYFRIDRDAPEEIVSYIQAAKRLGTNIVRIWCTGNPAVLTAEEKEMRYETCRKIAKIAEKMEAVDSPAFRMYWQPHPNQPADWNIAFAAATAQYVVNVHVFNWHGRERFPLAEAEMAWLQYAKALGCEHIYLLEHFQNDDPALLPQEAQTLRDILNASL